MKIFKPDAGFIWGDSDKISELNAYSALKAFFEYYIFDFPEWKFFEHRERRGKIVISRYGEILEGYGTLRYQ